MPADATRLVEPFCGSAAVSLAATFRGLTSSVWLNDIDPALMRLWSWILNRPNELADEYERLWNEQRPDKKDFFFKIRDEFNSTRQPHHLLYLLARIVKGAVRYSAEGNFNQSPDNRRSGMKPDKMRQRILGVSNLLGDKTELSATDFREMIQRLDARDLIYMDPPYQGTSFTRDHRYYRGLDYECLVDTLSRMNEMDMSYILSYDGATGHKMHGRPLPKSLLLTRHLIAAGRSSQATLLGYNRQTFESLYLSPALSRRLEEEPASIAQMQAILV